MVPHSPYTAQEVFHPFNFPIIWNCVITKHHVLKITNVIWQETLKWSILCSIQTPLDNIPVRSTHSRELNLNQKYVSCWSIWKVTAIRRSLWVEQRWGLNDFSPKIKELFWLLLCWGHFVSAQIIINKYIVITVDLWGNWSYLGFCRKQGWENNLAIFWCVTFPTKTSLNIIFLIQLYLGRKKKAPTTAGI